MLKSMRSMRPVSRIFEATAGVCEEKPICLTTPCFLSSRILSRIPCETRVS